jgi:hypothetical protein
MIMEEWDELERDRKVNTLRVNFGNSEIIV